MFDEISLGLAPVAMDKLYEALAALKHAGMTLIVIEQDVNRALALADQAYVLEHGVFSGPPKQIASDPRLRRIYVGAADLRRAARRPRPKPFPEPRIAANAISDAQRSASMRRASSEVAISPPSFATSQLAFSTSSALPDVRRPRST